MGYGEIIKRAWKITWRYRTLWVLGLFAGVAGGSSGGGSSANNNFNSGNGGSGTDSLFRALNPSRWIEQISRIIPVLIAAGIVILGASLVLWILRVAARGGLVQAVNAIEDGQSFTLGAAWNAGFSRFWPLLGLSILLSLPLALVALGLGLAIAIPFVLPLLRGASPVPASFAPLCGAFIIGVPLLLIGGVILGIMQELGLRSIMLDGLGVFDAAKTAWRSLRTRIKDALIMWFVNLGLNIASSIVVAIPVVIIVVALITPAIFIARSGSYGTLIGLSIVAFVVVTVLLMVYTAIWGTFTSALWTVFFRRLTGRELLAETVAAPMPPAAPPAAPAAPEGASL